MTATATECRRELAHRVGDGIEVSLLWDPCSDGVSIEVVDERDESAFVLRVEGACALDAFYHPYVYAGRRDEPVLAA